MLPFTQGCHKPPFAFAAQPNQNPPGRNELIYRVRIDRVVDEVNRRTASRCVKLLYFVNKISRKAAWDVFRNLFILNGFTDFGDE